jgi:CHAT domain-containing protein/lipopolysaccharide biosynthesis regulator YciM
MKLRHKLLGMGLGVVVLWGNSSPLNAITPNEVAGELDATDETFEDETFYEVHTFEGQAGETITIELQSEAFDTYLLLKNAVGNTIAKNDDFDGGKNSRIVIELPETATYSIYANSYEAQATGRYQLSWREATQTEILQAEADQLLQTAIEQYNVSQFREALANWEKSLKLYRQIGNRQGEASSLGNLGVAYESLGEYERAIAFHQQYLDIAREIGDRQGEASSLHGFGNAYWNLGEYQRAIVFYQQSLDIDREIGNRQGEAQSLGNLGVAYNSLGEYQRAIAFHQQYLKIAREIGDRQGEAQSLGNLGIAYDSLGEYQRAISFHQQSLDIDREIGDRQGEATSLGNLGVAYQSLGEYQRAIVFYQQYLDIAREIGDRQGEATSLGNLGGAYQSLGEYQRAIAFYQQSLEIAREIGDRQVEANSLGNLGSAYDSLGEYQRAISFHQQSLDIKREIGDRQGEAYSLGNLGSAYYSLGEYQRAIAFYQQSLEIAREIGDRQGEAYSLGNLGNAYDSLGEYQRAIAFYQQSLEIAREIGDRQGEAYSLGNLGNAYDSLGEYQRAISFYEQVLAISQEIGDRSSLSLTYANIGKLFKDQDQPALAIIFLKESTNIRESIRGGISGLDSSLQQSYLSTIAADYRLLADLLLQQDRILEAQRVLDLLKVQELNDLFDNVRAPEDQQFSTDDFRDPEKNFLALQDQRIAQALDIGTKIIQLEALPQRNDSQRQQLIALRKQEGEFLASFDDFLNSPPVQAIITELQAHLDKKETFNLFQAEELRGNLQNLQNTAILYPLILEDRLELVLVSANAVPLRHTVNISRTDLNRLISDARTALLNKNTDFTALEELHKILITPLEPTLEKVGIDTLLYAPDGALRYVPLAALTDGNQWLIEKYRLNNITALSLTDFDSPNSNQKPKVLTAAYTSGNHTIDLGYRQIPFKGLQYAGAEVQQIAATISGTESPRMDADFTKDLVYEMNDYSIVHLATHAKFLPAKPKDSFLVFGNGEYATIDQMKDWSTLTNVDLVVLSACETGVGDDLGSGVEILGLGYRLQSKGAKAVMSSLWQVQDDSTQVLMTEFYKNLQQGNISKAEALRQAQATLSKNPKYVHPYHWASFILIGNGL